MDNKLQMQAISKSIEDAFKSLMKSGRPDIEDENQKSIIKDLYVDIFNNDYVLNQVLDGNHLLLKGRRGTGKSTIFLRAEEELLKDNNAIPVYLNMQTIFEELSSFNERDVTETFTYYLTYKNFMTRILERISKEVKKGFLIENKAAKEIDKLFADIKNGAYYDKEFENSMEITSKNTLSSKVNIGGEINPTIAKLAVNMEKSKLNEMTKQEIKKEIRVFSIHEILKRLVDVVDMEKPRTIYLLIDDFSELDEKNQQVVVDSLIAPIISSYNSKFKVKIAAYPGRIYLGSIDSTKMPFVSLDFYDVFEQMSNNGKYNEIESMAIDYIERTLEKRLFVYTNNQISTKDLFEIKQANIEDYLKILFYSTACIPRAMGFILNYCYLNSINKGEKITKAQLNNATAKYYNSNILPDFQNDIRFKQSFSDDQVLLNHLAQINLKNKISEKSKLNKKEIIQKLKDGTAKDFFMDILGTKIGSSFIAPTSHFYINKDKEKLLKTLELYFIVTKFNEGSSRNSETKESFYALNYGLCIEEKIDFGKPENNRRSYDYWRQSEFNYNSFIPQVLSNIEEITCTKCGKIYSESHYEVYLEEKNCFKCGQYDSVKKVNKFSLKMNDKINEWSKRKLPDMHFSILRVLFNNQDSKLSAFEVATQIDKHHLGVTKSAERLLADGLINYVEERRRYYFITDKAVSMFFTTNLEFDN